MLYPRDPRLGYADDDDHDVIAIVVIFTVVCLFFLVDLHNLIKRVQIPCFVQTKYSYTFNEAITVVPYTCNEQELTS